MIPEATEAAGPPEERRIQTEGVELTGPLLVRMVRALWVLGIIVASYLSQLLLARLTEHWERDPETDRDVQRIPEWLKRRKRRIDQANAKRLLAATLELRGVYIKLGQVLSIMGGFLPRVYTKELERLQDAVPPRPWSEIAGAFEESLGMRPDAAFASIEESPIAAASLGQVHVAYLRGEDGVPGEKVAVKVLYPGIRALIAIDMQVIRLGMHIYQFFVPVVGLERVHSSLVDLLARETNYLVEAASMRRMAENFARQKDMVFPRPIEPLTTRDVLTMTFLEGTKINRIDELVTQNIEPRAVAVRFIESFYKQLFVDHFFHADPHPGNFLVQPGRTPRRPRLVVLDFGAVSELDPRISAGMIDVIGGLLDKNGKRLLDGFLRMGFASREANRDLLEKTVEKYFQKLLRIQNRTPAALMKASQRELEALVDPEVAREELRELMVSIEYPDGWFYVERASVLAFWLCAQIDPELDPMQVGYPYVMPLIEAARAGLAAEHEHALHGEEPAVLPAAVDESLATAEGAPSEASA
jgi:predicted unusual protein kinase regulating ubiquinone biosynthesis (AarF/ABC1/UbiB family)